MVVPAQAEVNRRWVRQPADDAGCRVQLVSGSTWAALKKQHSCGDSTL